MHDTNTILIALVAITGFSVLIQIGCLLALAITASKALKAGKELADEARAMAAPVLQSSKELIQHSKEVMQATQAIIAKLEPRLDSAASDLAEMARMAREETEKIQASADEIQDRVRRQAARVDSMTTSVLNTAESTGHFLNNVVTTPVRQVSGVLAAAKAIIETLRGPAPARRLHARDSRVVDESGQFV